MSIQEKEVLIAEIERFKEEAMKSYVVSCWAESYTNTDPFGYVILENENNKVWWLKTQAYQLWEMWQAAKAQAVPEGFVLVPKEPNEDQWGGFARLLGRYMQSHSRYCPSNLKKYIEHFESIPDWLNREVTNWESDHAFATADLPVFIYKAMIEAQEPAND